MSFDRQGRLFVADMEGDRILVLREGTVVDVYGRLGQGPGEFYRPAGLAQSNGRLFVAEQGNYRIQVLDTSGEALSSFFISFVPGYLGGTSSGQVLVNNPRGGSLFEIYDPTGKLLAKRGRLLTSGEAYPQRPELLQSSLNRAMLINLGDDVYVVFQYVPLVQKWTVQGRKLWSKRIEGENVNRLVAGLFGDADGRVLASRSTEGEPQLAIIISASCLSTAGELLLTLSDQTLLRISRDGAEIDRRSPEKGARHVFNAMAERDGILYFASESSLFREKQTSEKSGQ